MNKTLCKNQDPSTRAKLGTGQGDGGTGIFIFSLLILAFLLLPNPTLAASTHEIKQAQTKLGLTIDGIYGPQTKQAVITFQKENGLVPDGLLGPLTIAALKITTLPAGTPP